MTLAIIVAVAKNGVIGADNKLLWRLKTDLRRFKALTIGKPLIMGRKTYDSIGRPLPGRETIVVTRDQSFSVPGVHVCHGLPEALAKGDDLAASMGSAEVMVGGGGEIYAAALSLVERLYVTEVDIEPAGDAVFPSIPSADWRVVRREEQPRGLDDEAAFAFIDYVRR